MSKLQMTFRKLECGARLVSIGVAISAATIPVVPANASSNLFSNLALSMDPPCEDMNQWKESDIGPDDHGHTSNFAYNPNVSDPNGEWSEEGYAGVTDGGHSSFEDGKIAQHHTIVCAGTVN